MDKRGIAIFLLLTFALEWALLAIAWTTVGSTPIVSLILFLIILWTPALAAFFARINAAPNDDSGIRIWPIPVGAVFRVAIAVFLVFVCIHALLTVFGIVSPEWRLGTLMNQVQDVLTSLGMEMDPATARAGGAMLLVAMPVFSVLVGGSLYAALALGSELGWRAFLLPRLLPLGRVKAEALVGLLWGLWLLPVLYRDYVPAESVVEQPWFIPRFLLVTVFLGIALGEITRRTGLVTLAAVALGVFAAQLQGLWPYLFSGQQPPWSGPFGVVAVVVWGIASLLPGIFSRASSAPSVDATASMREDAPPATNEA